MCCNRTLLAACCLLGPVGNAWADIDLLFDPATQTVPIGTVAEIDMVARSDDATTQHFAALEAILHWDPMAMDLLGVDDGPSGYPFLSSHFLPDPDGINDDLHDGDALFTALAPAGQEAPVPPEGLIVTRLRFQALARTPGTVVCFLSSLGQRAVTRLRRLDLTNVTGDISATGTVTIVVCGTGDGDGDNDVDLADFAEFQRCFTGGGEEGEPVCQCLFDVEPDQDVDLDDFEEFAQGLSGPSP